MENKELTHYHWYRCENSHCFHLVLGNIVLTFSPEQLLVVANSIDEMRQEVLREKQTFDISFANTELLM